MNRNDRAIVGLVMMAHAMVHTYELSIPILVSIWLDQFEVTRATIGYVVFAGTALFGLGALPAGVLADAYGSQRLIVLCLVGMGGSFLVLGAAPGVPAIALALVLWGAAASVYHPSGLSLVSKGVTRRGEAFAYHGMAGNLGIALGPLVTTLLLLAFGWRTVVAILAVPAGLATLLALSVDVDETAAVGTTEGEDAVADGGAADDAGEPAGDDDAADDGEPSRDAGDARATGSVSSLSEFAADSRLLFSGAFLLVFGVVVMSGLYYRGVLTFLPDLLSDLPFFEPIDVGGTTFEPARYLYSGLLMVGMLGQYVGGRLTDRMPTERGLALGFGSLAVVALLFVPAATAGVVPLLVASALLGFFLFSVQPFYQATVAEYSPPGTRGLSYGYTYLGVFGFGALGAALAGAVLTYANQGVLFVVFAALAATATTFALVLARRGGLGRAG